MQDSPLAHDALTRTGGNLDGCLEIVPDIPCSDGLSLVVGQNPGTSTRMLMIPSWKHLGGEVCVSILYAPAPGYPGSDRLSGFCVVVTVLNPY